MTRQDLTFKSALLRLRSAKRLRGGRTRGGGSLHVEPLEQRRLMTATSQDNGEADSSIIAEPQGALPAVTVVARKLFYNQSGTGGGTVRYDGNDAAINSLDDAAIATDKIAYRPDVTFAIRRLTTNAFFDSEPRVLGATVMWQGRGGTDAGTDEEIFRFDGSTTTQLTQNTELDRFPKMSSGGTIWERGNATTQEVIMWDGVSETPLTANSVFDGTATISGGRVAWQQGSGVEVDIMSWEAGVTTDMSNIAGSERNVSIDGNRSVWISGSGPGNSVMLKDGANAPVPIVTNLTSSLEDPRISEQNVVWEGFAGGTANDREIYLNDGVTTTRLTTNSFPDFDPRVSGNNVVWWGGVFNDFQVSLFDGVTTLEISSGVRNQFPEIDGDNVVWQSYDGHDYEIMLWNGHEVIQLTNNDYDDTTPQLSGSHVAWVGQLGLDGTTYEIFDAVFAPAPATFANVSSYTKGINGIMVDIAGAPGPISAADFVFKVGNNNSPSTWGTANAPTSISVRAGAGVNGSDRVEIIWTSGAPFKQWLEVTMLANANTGLEQKDGYPAGVGDQFYFGNAPGNTGAGDTVVNSLVTAVDEAGIRVNNALLSANIPITNVYDVNRNAGVSAIDESAARLNGTNPATALKYLNLSSPPLAPQGDGGDGAIASALAATPPAVEDTSIASSSASTGGTAANSPSEELTVARQLLHWARGNTPRARAILAAADSMFGSGDLDDDPLAALAGRWKSGP
jgi:hypothetical protein